jgi:hypothetical protein
MTVLRGLPELDGLWYELMAEHEGKTEFGSYKDGTMIVNVFDHILYHELSGFRRGELLGRLRERLPDVPLKNIVFRHRCQGEV